MVATGDPSLATDVVAGIPDLVGQALVAVGAPPGLLVIRGFVIVVVVAELAARSGVVPGVADVLAQLVAGVADLVGQALVAVALAPGFLGFRLALAIGLLHVVHGAASG